jgi:hypothetical protein
MRRSSVILLAAANLAVVTACSSPTDVTSGYLRARLVRGAADSIDIENITRGSVTLRVMSSAVHGLLSSTLCAPGGWTPLAAGARQRVAFPDNAFAMPAGASGAALYASEAVISHCPTDGPVDQATLLRVSR